MHAQNDIVDIDKNIRISVVKALTCCYLCSLLAKTLFSCVVGLINLGYNHTVQSQIRLNSSNISSVCV